MTLRNVRLILTRELRDQLRDRRTLFMIAVLPLVLYPLLGLTFFQLAQILQEQPAEVWVVGARHLADLPPLVENNRFARALFAGPAERGLLHLHFAPGEPRRGGPAAGWFEFQQAEARRLVEEGKYDAAVVIPEDLGDRLDLFRQAMRRADAENEAPPLGAQAADAPAAQAAGALARPAADAPGGQAAKASSTPAAEPGRGPLLSLEVPSPKIIYSKSRDRSLIAFARLSAVLQRWTEQVGAENLAAGGLPLDAARPFAIENENITPLAEHEGLATWAKVLPMLLVIWAMTGAFYPAVDLCAGEKERGTLETLLCSPAARSEIVLGKLLTVMLFSMVTAALNLLSMGLTGWVALSRVPGFGPPPLRAWVWLGLALVPLSALFGALSLALAAFARSTKEGQYYLVPLMLVTMPLAVLPMSPVVELNLGTGLLPITGVALLLRSAIEGSYWQALQYAPVVAAVTLGGCLLAVRWAVEQFNSEALLFREGERLEVGLWMRHLLRDRQPTPTAGAAVFCGMLILVLRFFLGLGFAEPKDFASFGRLVLATQLLVVLAPAAGLSLVLVRSRKQTFLLRWPRTAALGAAALLAVALHPVIVALDASLLRLYPPSERTLQTLLGWQELILQAPLWQRLLLVALLPAVCEELAFRGFILCGLRHLGHKWRAIIYAALFFGLTHGILQQSITASLLGAVLGYVAVQTASIYPGMVFHTIHNALPLVAAEIPRHMVGQTALRALLVPAEGGAYAYSGSVVAAGLIVAGVSLAWFARLPYPKSAEEAYQEALGRHSQSPADRSDWAAETA